jgi:DNA-binding NarL/FixJ family response regulator
VRSIYRVMSDPTPPVDVMVLGLDIDMRDLVEAIVELAEDFRLIAAGEPDTGVAWARQLQPPVIVVDLEPAETTPGARIRQLREASPAAHLVAMSGFPDPVTLLDVLRNGASDYIDKATAWRDLLPALRSLGREPALP